MNLDAENKNGKKGLRAPLASWQILACDGGTTRKCVVKMWLDDPTLNRGFRAPGLKRRLTEIRSSNSQSNPANPKLVPSGPFRNVLADVMVAFVDDSQSVGSSL